MDACYNVVRNSLIDVSALDSAVVDGFGYKFGVRGDVGRAAAASVRRPGLFQNLCRTKTASFQNLLYNLCEHVRASLSSGV